MAHDFINFYVAQSPMTGAGRHAWLFGGLPSDVGDLARIIQGLLIYDVVAEPFYGRKPPEARQDEIHLRRVEDMLECVVDLDDRPLSAPRACDKRLVSRCHHFALLLVSMLRAREVPARARCGFGAYFNAPKLEDHWVAEYWDAKSGRWVTADAQLDQVWRRQLSIDFDPQDLPPGRFLSAAEAWQRCRSGQARADDFGIEFAKLRGLWFVAGSLVRDLAALNKVEMLPWDVWGAQPGLNAELSNGDLSFFDGLAAIIRTPDATFQALREVYSRDHRLRVPPKVFNALRQREEEVPSSEARANP